MEKLLVTGAGGFLGSHIVNLAKSKFKVYGTSNKSKINLPTDCSFYFDHFNSTHLLEILDKINPNYIIHCAAISSEGECKADKEKATIFNVELVDCIKNWCLTNNCRLVFTSSDLIFDGNHAPYDEQDEVNPKLIYGELKRQAELKLIGQSKISIVRLPLLYGIGLGDKKGLLQQFIKNCNDSVEQSLFVDEFRTPAYVADVADFLLKLLLLNHFGILHLGGKEKVSRFELGLKFCQYLNLSSQNLKPIERADIDMEDRPSDTSLNSELAYSLGFSPKSLKYALTEIAKNY